MYRIQKRLIDGVERLSRRKKLMLLVYIVGGGFLLPQPMVLPVEDADAGDYHPESFWYYPWGKSGTHKGVDIFAPKGKKVYSATFGIVVKTGTNKMGGNVVWVLGPKWRLHYYAHLQGIETSGLSIMYPGRTLGTVGDSGNARGKSPHLHYSIQTLIPYPWRIDGAPQGWRKMWYLNPIDYF